MGRGKRRRLPVLKPSLDTPAGWQSGHAWLRHLKLLTLPSPVVSGSPAAGQHNTSKSTPTPGKQGLADSTAVTDSVIRAVQPGECERDVQLLLFSGNGLDGL